MAFDYETLLNWHFEEVTQAYTRKDSILYALGLGFGFNPTDPEELKFVYEKGLVTFPTMAVVLGHPGPWLTKPEAGVDMSKVLHGEQYLEIHKPLPIEGTVTALNRVIDVIDKGTDKGAVIITERKLFDKASGNLLCIQNATILARGNGGFGGPVTSTPKPHVPPEREPDYIVDISTATQAALLYRLNGDYNALHVDPKVAEKAGFTAPILHGLASYGVAARAVLKACDIKDVSKLRSIRCRFSSPVYPGETLRTEVWKNNNQVWFRVRVVQRDTVVLNNGYAIID